ncbi:MAG: hypothetical protein MJA83_17305, partial [Gammaproteobacteria bacterium]|nr:hypothetical protein [Gammaproteobacteria bacterium]
MNAVEKTIVGAAFLICPRAFAAADPAVYLDAANGSALTQLLHITSGLAVVLLTIFALSWVLRRVASRNSTTDALQINGEIRLGAKERIVLLS